MRKDFDRWNNIKKEIENKVFLRDDFPFPKKEGGLDVCIG